MNVKKIPKWKLSGMPTSTRVFGKIGFNRNCGGVDLWIRDKHGDITWYGIDYQDLLINLIKSQEHEDHFYLNAESDMELEG